MKDIRVHENLFIPATELEVSYARSSGPGGQNVNKVNSKVTLKWALHQSELLPMTVLDRLRVLAKSRLLDDGSLQVTSQVHRDQLSNLRDCVQKIQHLVLAALNPPKSRKPTRPSAGSNRRRLEEKAKRSQTKTNRNSGGWDG
jgi:ribosome-associated protein